jgi:hypothetical protein
MFLVDAAADKASRPDRRRAALWSQEIFVVHPNGDLQPA